MFAIRKFTLELLLQIDGERILPLQYVPVVYLHL